MVDMKKTKRGVFLGSLFGILAFSLQNPGAGGIRTGDLSGAGFFVSPTGNDRNPGTEEKPFATLHRAQAAVRLALKAGRASLRVLVREGTYHLSEPLEFGPEDSGAVSDPVVYAAYPKERVTLSGGRSLRCDWKPYRDGILMSRLPGVKNGGLAFSQLFINGHRQVRARFPNADDSKPGVSGYILAGEPIPDDLPDPRPDPDADMTFSSGAPRGIFFRPENFSRNSWARPQDAVIHIFMKHYWGNLQWRIKAVDRDRNILWFGRGGFQMGAKYAEDPCAVGPESRYFIENVFEELDAPGEWSLDREEGVLYFRPPAGTNMSEAVVEVPVLEQAVRFIGDPNDPVSHITFAGFRVTLTASTFLAPYEIPSLSDWAIHRGGAVFLEGTRDITIKECWFDAVGGNAVFMSKYNRGNTVTGCTFTEAGDSGICLVGELETTVGTQRNFPYECRAVNNLIHDCGVFSKQVAGVYISRAKRIAVAHNLIFNMPRAAVCIGDGTWGGHVIEYNHFHDTCRETGDHGPFNSWGRDRYWCLTQSHTAMTASRSHDAGKVKVDAMETTILRHNFVEESRGWGLDLDDGSSNYDLYNNICVGVSVKLREGAYRHVHNNIWVNSGTAPGVHVGYEDNHDRIHHNIIVVRGDDCLSFIGPPARGPWLEELDFNCYFKIDGSFTARVSALRVEDPRFQGPPRRYSLEDWQGLGWDRHSVFADPLFVDPGRGDYRVKPESPALKLGFKNFEMGTWGLTSDFPETWRAGAGLSLPKSRQHIK